MPGMLPGFAGDGDVRLGWRDNFVTLDEFLQEVRHVGAHSLDHCLAFFSADSLKGTHAGREAGNAQVNILVCEWGAGQALNPLDFNIDKTCAGENRVKLIPICQRIR